MSSLNSKQLEAINTSITGPVLVLAGAGSGKTTVLINRIEYLVKNNFYKPENILAITFTNKAGNEIKKRLIQKTSLNLDWIGTFHSICFKILKKHIGFLDGRNPNFKIIDQEDSLKIIKEIYQENEYDNKEISYKNMLNFIEKLKIINNSIEINKNIIFNHIIMLTKKTDIVLNVLEQYEKKLKQLNYLDFNDLLIYTNYLLANYDQVRSYWQNQFKYILVDEFQDTNDIQFELLLLLSDENKNIFTVGDNDQTIYSFRGSNPEIINNFINLMKEKNIIFLEQNYRSTPEILNAANTLISKNRKRISKNLFTKNENGKKPIYFLANDEYEESIWVIQRIKEIIKNNGSLSSIAILFRNNYLSRQIEQILMDNNINYKLFGGLRFYQRAEIKDMISYLNVINDNDSLSLKRILNVPNRKIGITTEEEIERFAQENFITFAEALMRFDEINISTAAKNSINNFWNLINKLKSYEYKSINDLLNEILKETDYLDYCEKKDNTRINIIKDNIIELKKAILNFEQVNPNLELSDYLQNINLFSNDDANDQDNDYISLMTVHNAKGLEFDNVFIICFNNNIFPNSNCLDFSNTFDDLEEERRVAYVAITRAKKQLYISANKGFDFKTQKEKTESIFVSDISKSNLEIYEKKQYYTSNFDKPWFDSYKQKEEKLNNFDTKKENDFEIGDLVSHVVFGSGKIIKIDGDLLYIQFNKPFGIKTIMFNHKSIKRVFR